MVVHHFSNSQELHRFAFHHFLANSKKGSPGLLVCFPRLDEEPSPQPTVRSPVTAGCEQSEDHHAAWPPETISFRSKLPLCMTSTAKMSSALQTDASMVEDDCARNALTRDNPTAMTQLSNAESSRLEALSDELLVSIVEKLVYEGHCAAEIAEFHARINLRHLCLVSKRMDLIARPYLYKKVTITDFDSLAKLHRTISRDPQLGEEIKEIDLNVDFGSATFRKWLAVADNEEFVDKFGQFHPSRKFMRSNRLVGGLCHSVLTGAVNTSSLKMSFRDTKRRDVTFRRDHLENLYLPNRCTPYSGFLDRIGDSLRLSRGGVEFLPRLETLTLCGLSQRLAIEVLKPFLDLPSLKTVQTRGDDGNWCLIAPGSSHSRRIYGGEFLFLD